MPNNVLDRSAMATLSRLENELPHIGEALVKLATGQDEIRQDQKEITRSLSSLCKDVAVTTARCQRNTEDIEAQGKQLETIRDDVVGLKTTNKIMGGANAVYTTLATLLTNLLNGVIS